MMRSPGGSVRGSQYNRDGSAERSNWFRASSNVPHVGNRQTGLVKSPMAEAAIVLSAKATFSYRAVLVLSMSAVRGRP